MFGLSPLRYKVFLSPLLELTFSLPTTADSDLLTTERSGLDLAPVRLIQCNVKQVLGPEKKVSVNYLMYPDYSTSKNTHPFKTKQKPLIFSVPSSTLF